MKMDFIPVDYDHFDFNGRNYIKVYGRNQDGKKICVIDSFNPYFWAIIKEGTSKKKIDDLMKKIGDVQLDIKGRKSKVEKVILENKEYLGSKVKALKIWGTNYKDLQNIAEQLTMEEIEKRRGYDLNQITNYIIEDKLEPLRWYEIEGEVLFDSQKYGGIDNIIKVDFVLDLESKKLKKNQLKFSPKGLAYDLETDSLKPSEGEILMISLVGDNYKKVITWKKAHTENKSLIFVNDERELIQKFIELVKDYSPDFLIGYNSDYFDLPFLKERAKKLKMRLNLGLDNSEVKISKGTSLSGRISGITHIDLLKFIRVTYSQYMQSETLSLNEVSKEFLGDKKKNFKFQHSSKIQEKKWAEYYEYNLHDSVLAFQLFQKFWLDILEFSKIIKEPVYEISRNGLSKQIESYVLHNLEKYNEIPEKRPGYNEIEFRKSRKSVEGAFVYEPKPGIYENLAMFDFTSMHTSIIITHNISKGTLIEDKKNAFASPEIDVDGKKVRFYFMKTPRFFPLLLKEIFEKRKHYKEEYKKNPTIMTKARSNAFKLLAWVRWLLWSKILFLGGFFNHFGVS